MAAEHTHSNGHSNGHGHSHATAAMAEAAASWLDSLSAEQRDKATYEYMDGERVFWYYPPLNRHGLALRDMDDNQRKLAYAIMESGLTERAYKQAAQIIDLETTLGKVEKDAGIISFRRDPELYYFTVFGDPRDSETPWAWRVEGHHVSLHYSIWGDKVISTTPFFFGSNPAEVLNGPDKGKRILGDREDIALELVNGLSSEQQRRAVIYPEAPYDILTYNSSRAVFPQEEGLPGSQMNGSQREMMMSIISEYVSTIRDDVAQDKMSAVRERGLTTSTSHGAEAWSTSPSTTIAYTAATSSSSTTTARTTRTTSTPSCATRRTTSPTMCCASTCSSITCYRRMAVD